MEDILAACRYESTSFKRVVWGGAIISSGLKEDKYESLLAK
jgi:hypothetical protein